MGRFYNTASPVFVDNKMLKLPYEVMGKVLEKRDTEFKDALNKTFDLAGQLEANALPQQQEQLNQRFQQYEDRIETLATDLQKDPVNYSKKLSNIRGLRRDIHTDFTRGDVKTIQGNFDSLQNYKKQVTEDVKNKRIKQSDADFLINKRVSEFQGQDDKGRLNTFEIENLSDFADVQKIGEELGKGYEADKEYTAKAGPSSNYIWKSKTTKETVTPEDIYNDVYEGILNNETFNKYYDQQTDLRGNINKEDIAKAEAERVASKYGYLREDGDKSVKVDSSKSHSYAGIKKQEENKELTNFWSNDEHIPTSVSDTEEGLNTKAQSYQKSISDNREAAVATVKSIWNTASPEDVNLIVSGILKGSLSNEQIEEVGLSRKTVDNLYTKNKEAQILLNQNTAVHLDWKNSDTPSYEDYVRINKISKDAIRTVDYSLQGFGFDAKTEVPVLQKHVANNLGSGYLNFDDSPEIIKAARDKGIIGNLDTRVSLQQLSEGEIITPKSDLKVKRTDVVGEPIDVKDYENAKWYQGWGIDIFDQFPVPTKKSVGEVETKLINFQVNLPGFSDFVLEPTTLGVGNVKDEQGNVNLAMKANLSGGRQIAVKYPINKLGDKRINAKANANSKVLDLHRLLDKGVNAKEYNLSQDYKVVKTAGIQHIHKRNSNTGTWKEIGSLNSISKEDYRIIANSLFK